MTRHSSNPLRSCALFHVLLALSEAKQMMQRSEGPTSVKQIDPASISVKTATEITFAGAADGDKADDDDGGDAGAVMVRLLILQGIGRITLQDEAEALKLCFQGAGKTEVEEQTGIALAVVPGTDTAAISGINPTTVTQGVATTMTLMGAGAGSKAIFLPAKEDCRDATPTVELDGNSKGLFTINGAGGSYKLCYRGPGGSDSVEQNPEAGPIVLKVEQALATPQDQISSISPNLITSNVATTIALVGASEGDKAIFVNSETSECESATPDKDVGSGHASFNVDGAGTYVLCFTAKGAADSVQQKGISLTVKAPGVAQNMLGRWSSKNGELDCGSLSQVPYCSAAGINTCERSYAIQSGIGYKCFWNTGVWPPACDVDMGTDERTMICSALPLLQPVSGPTPVVARRRSAGSRFTEAAASFTAPVTLETGVARGTQTS
ncbi:hypothetical protein AK812_SmicGene9943 [Symbiodinium microadriaticum]|uniref:Uncharacterized protein n=1 Tax=Symbiodinium microadriaticum TaxID=2951 RepID=A0A1Q9EH43_SYMMI|nr:hypothetical protein AK812_SmicGene9943 [Symbiodinium microadriaticum]